MKKMYLCFLLAIFGCISLNAQKGWIPAYEDGTISIEHQLVDCNDSRNGFNFGYHFLKIENKTHSQINVRYVLGEAKNGQDEEEISVNLILEPKQILIGNCDSGSNLRLFARDNNSQDLSKSFKISKIKTYAL